jgi:hypothetical protein
MNQRTDQVPPSGSPPGPDRPGLPPAPQGERVLRRSETTMPVTRARNGTRVTLVLIELFIGANAVWGGIMLMTDSWNLGHGWLDNTFFESWFLPGVALLVIIGARSSPPR